MLDTVLKWQPITIKPPPNIRVLCLFESNRVELLYWNENTSQFVDYMPGGNSYTGIVFWALINI